MPPIDSVNSFNDAIIFWNTEYGRPDIYSRQEHITTIMDTLLKYEEELDTLERYVKNVEYENINHYKLNRCITLHFIVTAAEQYITKLNNVVNDNMYEDELEKLNKKSPINWEF